jgi:hypothetical protein
MSNGKKIVESLQLLDSQKKSPFDTQTGVMAVEKIKHFEKVFDGATVQVDVLDVDRYSLVISKIEIQAAKIRQGRPVNEFLQSQANLVIDKIDYLPEAFALIELDEKNGVAQIRSRKPLRNSGFFEYFEIMLKNGAGLSFQRYQKRIGDSQKKSIPVVLTYELFERLIDDILALWQ